VPIGFTRSNTTDGAAVRLYTRNAVDLTATLPAIAAAAERIEATSFTIDGEAVVLGPDGLSRFDELCRRAAAQTAILYAFDLSEHDGEDLHDRPFLDRKAELALLLRDTRPASCSTSTSPRTVPPSSRTLVGLAPRASSQSGWMAPIVPVRAGRGSRSAIPRASPCRESAARIGTDEPQAARAGDEPPQGTNHPRLAAPAQLF
jgi:hypothetical protein